MSTFRFIALAVFITSFVGIFATGCVPPNAEITDRWQALEQKLEVPITIEDERGRTWFSDQPEFASRISEGCINAQLESLRQEFHALSEADQNNLVNLLKDKVFGIKLSMSKVAARYRQEVWTLQKTSATNTEASGTPSTKTIYSKITPLELGSIQNSRIVFAGNWLRIDSDTARTDFSRQIFKFSPDLSVNAMSRIFTAIESRDDDAFINALAFKSIFLAESENEPYFKCEAPVSLKTLRFRLENKD